MVSTSTLVRPQQVLIECLLTTDASNNTITPALFSAGTENFLKDRKIIAIESFCRLDMPFSPISPGVPVITAPQFKNAWLLLMRNDGNGVHGGDFVKVPLTLMRRIINTGALGWSPELFRLDPTTVSWTDSSINTANSISSSTLISVPFLVTYLLEAQDPEPFRTVKLKQHATR